jgi:hypothetical protein
MNRNSTGFEFRRRFSRWPPALLIVLGYVYCAASPAEAGTIAITGVGVIDGVAVATFSVDSRSDPAAFSFESEFSAGSQPNQPPGSATGLAYADKGGTLKLLEQASGQAASIAGAEFRISGHLSGPTIALFPYGWNGNGWVVGVSLDVHGTLTGDPNESVVSQLVVGTDLQGIVDRQIITTGGAGPRSLTGVAITSEINQGVLDIVGNLNLVDGGTYITNGSASFEDTATLRFDLPAGVTFTTDDGVVFGAPTNVVPEPASLTIFVVGAVCLMGCSWWRQIWSVPSRPLLKRSNRLRSLSNSSPGGIPCDLPNEAALWS